MFSVRYNPLLFFNAVPYKSESAVHIKTENLLSLQVSRVVDTRPCPERGNYVYIVCLATLVASTVQSAAVELVKPIQN